MQPIQTRCYLTVSYYMCKTPISQVAYTTAIRTVWLITCIAQVHVAIALAHAYISKVSKNVAIALSRSAFAFLLMHNAQ